MTWGALMARFGVLWLDLAAQTATGTPRTTDRASNKASWEPGLAILAVRTTDLAPLATEPAIREAVWQPF